MSSLQNHWVHPPDNIGLTNGTVTGDDAIPTWTWGTSHLLEWTTPWEYFDLFLVQDNRPNYEDVILTNMTNIASFNWTVATDIINLDISRICWFKLHQTASEGHSFFESAAINISGGPSWPSSDLTTSTSVAPTFTTSVAPTSSLTLASTLTAVTALASTSSIPSPASNTGAGTTASPLSPQLILVIAFSISIPMILALGLFIGWKLRARKRTHLPPKATDNPTTANVVAAARDSETRDLGASQRHETFSPVRSSAPDDGFRYIELSDRPRGELAG